MTPDEAVAAARAAAAARRAEGGYADDLRGLVVEPTDAVTTEKLLEWALIEPDLDLVYSTRPYGRPITAGKRWLIGFLRQYLGQAFGQQTRFNHHLTIRIAQLEDRIAELESQLREK